MSVFGRGTRKIKTEYVDIDLMDFGLCAKAMFNISIFRKTYLNVKERERMFEKIIKLL